MKRSWYLLELKEDLYTNKRLSYCVQIVKQILVISIIYHARALLLWSYNASLNVYDRVTFVASISVIFLTIHFEGLSYIQKTKLSRKQAKNLAWMLIECVMGWTWKVAKVKITRHLVVFEHVLLSSCLYSLPVLAVNAS